MKDRTPEKSSKSIRTLLIARYPMVRESLKLLIEANKGLTVVETQSFREDSGRFALVTEADVAVIYLSKGDRVEIISDLLRETPSLRVLIIAADVDLDPQAEAVRLGAVGIVQKEQSPKLLIEAIKRNYGGETWLNEVLLNKILERNKSKRISSKKMSRHLNTDSLTIRELEVVKLIGEGLKNKSIAERLFISEATVRHHLSSIYGKVDVQDRLNLVIFAYRQGLIKLTS